MMNENWMNFMMRRSGGGAWTDSTTQGNSEFSHDSTYYALITILQNFEK